MNPNLKRDFTNLKLLQQKVEMAQYQKSKLDTFQIKRHQCAKEDLRGFLQPDAEETIRKDKGMTLVKA